MSEQLPVKKSQFEHQKLEQVFQTHYPSCETDDTSDTTAHSDTYSGGCHVDFSQLE